MPSSLSLQCFLHLLNAGIINVHLMPGSQLTQASYPSLPKGLTDGISPEQQN